MLKTILLATSLSALAACDAYADALQRFDVAEDHARFTFADHPVHANGMPAHGNPFLTLGYIYPAGTLSVDAEGVLRDGSPAFPEKVLGIWTCDGWFVGEGGNATTGVWLISHQVLRFKDGGIVISQDPEIVDENRPAHLSDDYDPYSG